MGIRRQSYGAPSFGTPPVTWRDATPSVQASWRRSYGCYVGAGKVSACLDSIRPASKTIAASQYLAKMRVAAPADVPQGFGMSSVDKTALGSADVGFLSLCGDSKSWTKFWCLKLTAWPAGASATVELQSSTPGFPPTQYNFVRIDGPLMTVQNSRQGSLGTNGSGAVAIPALNTTFVFAIAFDFATTTMTAYMNGALATTVVHGAFGGTQAAILAEDSFAGSYSASSQFPDGIFYERLFCVAALTGPQIAAASASMAADYPP